MKQFMQNRFLVLLVAILLTANLGLMLYFFVFRHKGEERRPQRPVSEYVQKKLGFNADQAAKFQQLRDQHKEAIKPVMEDMKKMKDSLYDLLRTPETNDSAARALTRRIGEKQDEWELIIFHHLEKVRALCDSSQLPKFDSLVHEMINRGPWMRKKRPAQN
jgi:hypothetical protein